jgi:hypothetical protein
MHDVDNETRGRHELTQRVVLFSPANLHNNFKNLFNLQVLEKSKGRPKHAMMKTSKAQFINVVII